VLETSVTPLNAPVGGSVALLFNFDCDGVIVKLEHQAFLLKHFVPPLRTALDLRVFLRGTAGQRGDATYNLQLSRRRVGAVRDFLLSRWSTSLSRRPAAYVVSSIVRLLRIRRVVNQSVDFFAAQEDR
jgi:hypothetical protein